MSRTKKGKRPCGDDFGARYSCDKHYLGMTGKVPKDSANSERRKDGKIQIRKENECL